MRLKAEITKIFSVFRTHILAGVRFEPTTVSILTIPPIRTKLKFQHVKNFKILRVGQGKMKGITRALEPLNLIAVAGALFGLNQRRLR